MVLDHMAITPFPVLYKCCNVLNKQRRLRSPAQLIKESKESNTFDCFDFASQKRRSASRKRPQVDEAPGRQGPRGTRPQGGNANRGWPGIPSLAGPQGDEAPGRRCRRGMARDPQGGDADDEQVHFVSLYCTSVRN